MQSSALVVPENRCHLAIGVLLVNIVSSNFYYKNGIDHKKKNFALHQVG